jgi:hypothetical protein
MYNINLEATDAAFIDLQKCELETELEVLYLSKGLQKTAGDTPWLNFSIKKAQQFFFNSYITDKCRDTSSDLCGKGKVFLYTKLD